jgi:hypothetical protein
MLQTSSLNGFFFNYYYLTGIDPYNVAWSLQKFIDWNIGFQQVFHHRPPGSMTEADVVPANTNDD